MADVQINLEIVTKAFEQALDNSAKKTSEFSNQASKNFTNVGSAFNVMAGNLAANAIGKALGFISDGFSNMIREASDSEKNVNELNLALKQSGIYTEAASERFQKLADSISENSTVDDDLILKSQALFATLNNLSEKGIGDATKRAVDLSAALGVDLSTATEMVSRAVNGSTIAFAKKGIVIKEGNTDEERLHNLLEATARFQGAAAGQTQTYSGAMEQQKNALGNLLAEFGSLVTTNSSVISGIQGTTGIFQSLTQFMKANSTEINTFIESLKISLPIIGAVGVAAGLTTVGFSGLAVAATATWAAITAPVTLVVAAIAGVSVAVYAIYRNWELLKAGTLEATAAILEYSAKAVGLLSEDKAQSLRDQAQGYRDQAQAIRDAKMAVEEKAVVDEAAMQRAVAKEKAEAEMLTATQQLRMDLRLVEEEAKLADDANELVRTDAKFARLVEQLGMEQAIHRQAQMNITTNKVEQEKLRLQTEIDANKKRVKDTQEMHQKVLDADKEQYDRQKEGRITYRAWEEQTDKEKLATTKDTLGGIATLTRSSNSTLFEIGKAAAVTNATIDGYAAVQKALASLPPPWNFAAALAVGTATAANVASIAGQSKPKFAQGGIVPGSSFTGDRVAAQVNSGEMILNKSQQGKLFQQINQGSYNSETNQLLSQLISAIKEQVTSVQIDGREIVSVVREQLASGRAI